MNGPTGWVLQPEGHWAPGDWDFLIDGAFVGTVFLSSGPSGEWFWGTSTLIADETGYAKTLDEGKAKVEEALREAGLL